MIELPGVSLTHRVRPAGEGANPPGVRPPLLVLLHGVRSHEGSVHAIADAMDPRFVVVSLRSPLTLAPGQFGWFTVQFIAGRPVIDEAQARAAWTRVPHVIDELLAATGADPARVYLGGFSQGGIIALATLLTAPERLAGAVVMSGRLLGEVLPHAASAERLAGKPLLWVHGTDDSVLGIAYLHDAQAKLAPYPLAFTAREFPMGHSIGEAARGAVAAWLTARLDAPPDATLRAP
ncbi:MAG: phospholipase [Gemmatimonadetes bacterium]|nr:phospholipase [Gemmatimonadota bacterium]